MTNIKAISYQLQTYRRGIFWSMVAMAVLLFGLYVYFINATVFNVITREKLEEHIADLTTNVSKIEFQNITLKNSVTLDKAATLGFAESNDTIFVSRSSKNLSYNNRP